MVEYYNVYPFDCSCESKYPIEAHELYAKNKENRTLELIDQGIPEDDALTQANLESFKLVINKYGKQSTPVINNQDIRTCCALTLATGKGEHVSYPTHISHPEEWADKSKTNFNPVAFLNTVDSIGQSDVVYQMGATTVQTAPEASKKSGVTVYGFILDDASGLPIQVEVGSGAKSYKVRALNTSEIIR